MLLLACAPSTVDVLEPIHAEGSAALAGDVPDATPDDTGDGGDTGETGLDDTSGGVETSSPSVTCETLDIRPGADDPVPGKVGDSWTFWLWCDDTLFVGAERLYLTPPEAGTIDETVVTWLVSGDVDVTMQAGSHRATETFTIDPY